MATKYMVYAYLENTNVLRVYRPTLQRIILYACDT